MSPSQLQSKRNRRQSPMCLQQCRPCWRMPSRQNSAPFPQHQHRWRALRRLGRTSPGLSFQTWGSPLANASVRRVRRPVRHAATRPAALAHRRPAARRSHPSTGPRRQPPTPNPRPAPSRPRVHHPPHPHPPPLRPGDGIGRRGVTATRGPLFRRWSAFEWGGTGGLERQCCWVRGPEHDAAALPIPDTVQWMADVDPIDML